MFQLRSLKKVHITSFALIRMCHFLNKAVLRECILSIEENSHVTIDTTKAEFIDHDILETIKDFLATTLDDNIRVEFIEINGYQRFSGIDEKHI